MVREALSLTQEDLAAIIRVTPRTVIRWEQGESSPSGDTILRKLADLARIATLPEPVKATLRAFPLARPGVQTTARELRINPLAEEGLAETVRRFLAIRDGAVYKLTMEGAYVAEVLGTARTIAVSGLDRRGRPEEVHVVWLRWVGGRMVVVRSEDFTSPEELKRASEQMRRAGIDTAQVEMALADWTDSLTDSARR